MKNEDSLKELLKEEFGVELPIEGGYGSSIEDAIKIDKNYEDWSDVIYTCLRLTNRLFGRSWKLVEQIRIKKNGRTYDKMKLKIESDPENTYSYYFDVTDHLNVTTLFGGGTAWPDEIPK